MRYDIWGKFGVRDLPGRLAVRGLRSAGGAQRRSRGKRLGVGWGEGEVEERCNGVAGGGVGWRVRGGGGFLKQLGRGHRAGA